MQRPRDWTVSRKYVANAVYASVLAIVLAAFGSLLVAGFTAALAAFLFALAYDKRGEQ